MTHSNNDCVAFASDDQGVMFLMCDSAVDGWPHTLLVLASDSAAQDELQQSSHLHRVGMFCDQGQIWQREV